MKKVDRYEYNVKSDEIKKLYNRRNFTEAAAVADEIDWYKVKDNAMLNRIADIYENTKQYEKAKEVLLIAYERSPLGRQLAYKLTILSLRTQNFDDADEFYQDFVEMSPTDDAQYLLKYRIARAKGEDLPVLIQILETYLKEETDERWQYELAKLYHDNGQDDKCVRMCNEIELWFNEGKYVTKARKLRSLITGIMEEYNKRYMPENFEKPVDEGIRAQIDLEDAVGADDGQIEAVEKSSEAGREEEKLTQAVETKSVADLNVEEIFPIKKTVDDSDEDILADEDFYEEDSRLSGDLENFDSEDETEKEFDEVETLAESIVASEEESQNQQAEEGNTFENLRDKLKNSESIKAKWSNFTRAIEKSDIDNAMNVLKAAQEAAVQAQKSADLAKAFADEVKLRVDYLRGITGEVRAKNEIHDLRAQLDEKERILENGTIKAIDGMDAERLQQIFEEKKQQENESVETALETEQNTVPQSESNDAEEKKPELGEELKHTTEFNPDEIKVKIMEDDDDPSKTANIQEALRKSMEKLRQEVEAERLKKLENAQRKKEVLQQAKAQAAKQHAAKQQVASVEEEVTSAVETVAKEPVKEEAEEEIAPVIESVVEEPVKEEAEEEIAPAVEAVAEEPVKEEAEEEITPVIESVVEEPVKEEAEEEITPVIESVVEEPVKEEVEEEITPVIESVVEEPVKEEAEEEIAPVIESVVEEPVKEVVEEEVAPVIESVVEEPVKEEAEEETVSEIEPIEAITPAVEQTDMESEEPEIQTAAASIIHGIADMEEISPETAEPKTEHQPEIVAEPLSEEKEEELSEEIPVPVISNEELAESVKAMMEESVEEPVEESVEEPAPEATIEKEDSVQPEMTEMLDAFEEVEMYVKPKKSKRVDRLSEFAAQQTEEIGQREEKPVSTETESQPELKLEETSTDTDETVDKTEAKDSKKIPKEYKELFDNFANIDSMEETIALTLNNLIDKFDADGTSSTNNVVITGSAKSGKTTLGLSLIKAANRGRGRNGRRVAKIKATALNKRGVSAAMAQILGTDLIIEQAGNLMPNTLIDLMTVMKNYTEEMLIVMEDDKAAIDRMLISHPDLKKFFNNRLDIVELGINDMVKIAREYALSQFYEIDDMGELALAAKLDELSGKNPDMSADDIKDVIDDAIEHASKFSIGKIFGKMKKGKGEYQTLSEQDFL